MQLRVLAAQPTRRDYGLTTAAYNVYARWLYPEFAWKAAGIWACLSWTLEGEVWLPAWNHSCCGWLWRRWI